jgi:arabinofuranosyltransferase
MLHYLNFAQTPLLATGLGGTMRSGIQRGLLPNVFWWALVALACALYLAGVARANFVSDDAFIAFRYARNLARGLGLVWNPGERVEGYSDFLLVVALALLQRLGADLVVAGRALSAAAGVACVVGAGVLARRLLPSARLAAAGAAFVVASSPYLAAWGSAGLETTLFAALAIAMALPVTGRPLTAPGFARASALGLLLALTRPEGVALYAALALASFASARGGLRERVALLGPGAALFAVVGAAYFAWRVWYFGDWLPNTFYAKSGFTARHAVRGLGYLAAFGANWFVWLELPLAIAGAVVAVRRRQLAVPVLGASVVAIVIGVGGDGLPMYRFLVPALPFLAVLAATGASALPRPQLGFAALGLVCALSFFPRPDTQYLMMVEQRDYEIPAWRAAGLSLGRALAPDALVAAVPIGALGWYSELPILDMVGLTDRTIARAPVVTGSGWAGHEKHDGAYVLARKPDAILLGNILVANAPRVEFSQFPTFTNPYVAAREGDVPAQPEFARDYVQAALPLAPGATLHFFLRRGARTADPRYPPGAGASEPR